ncbi:MAG TPA: hypothetical protein VLH10_10610 [Yinghuangia sp.]|uniref:hypothetical protein n=1 Tax=Yinghuangia sp. YIM S10712 TaxID=3436930 RepID=UPI002C3C0FC4|nr:hypothetical protein [Yinghuangia sp.]
MPPHQAYACEYTTNWIATKLRWGLTIDPVEQQVLADQAAASPDVEITGIRAR